MLSGHLRSEECNVLFGGGQELLEVCVVFAEILLLAVLFWGERCGARGGEHFWVSLGVNEDFDLIVLGANCEARD